MSASTAQPRVLLIVPWFNLGGADRFNLNLVQQLTQRGHAVTVCATVASANPWLAEFARHTPEVFSLPGFVPPEDQPTFILQLIESDRIDVVVISNSMLGYALLPYWRAHCPNTLFVDYNHMVVERDLQGGFPRLAVQNQSQLDLNIVSSQQVKDWMVTQGADPARIEVCYTNQDVTHWNPARFDRASARQKLNLLNTATVLLYPARLEPQKRPRVLAEILRRLAQVERNFVCLIVGDGPQRGWLEAALKRHRLTEHARLLGAVAPEEMPELMAASDILLLPSEDEGIALTVFEAMAMELVVVSAEVGGQRELVTSEVGYLIPHGPAEIERYVATLTQLIRSPITRAQMGQAARQRIVVHFTLEQMAERMSALFDKARHLAQTEPRPRLGEADAQALSEHVVVDLRYDRLQEYLRADPPFAMTSPERGGLRLWRKLIHWLKLRVLRPAYSAALRNGWDWVVPLANWLYRHLRWVLK